VVGDASQTIYSFTGASSSYLLDFPRWRRGATVVRLVRDYRSTPQVVGLANAVIGQARGELAKLRLELIGQRPSGPEPEIRTFADEPVEALAVAARCAELIAGGVPASEIAVLFRVNAQSEVYEEALAEAGVPYVVYGAERFFERAEVRQAMVALRAATRTTPPDTPLREAVVGALEAAGWRPDAAPSGGAARERWEAVAALVALVDEDPARSLEAFCAELQRRVAAQHAPTVEGVTLSSLHSAKGLEWDAVFLVGLADGTLPTQHARTAEALEEERRLLYVGVTRARHTLWLSYGVAGRAGPGRVPVPADARRRRRAGRCAGRFPQGRAHGRRLLPDLRHRADQRGRPQARPVRDLPVRPRRGALRPAAGVAGRRRRRAAGSPVRGVHRRVARGDRRAAAVDPRAARRDRRDRAAQAGALRCRGGRPRGRGERR
jgi:DNA helicase II / ATP-dependent DNA helicase PcrA